MRDPIVCFLKSTSLVRSTFDIPDDVGLKKRTLVYHGQGTATLSHPVSVPRLNPPWRFPGKNLFCKITLRRKKFGFFTYPKILHKLFHPGKNTASLIVSREFLDFNWWVLYYPYDVTDTPWCVATSHRSHGNAR